MPRRSTPNALNLVNKTFLRQMAAWAVISVLTLVIASKSPAQSPTEVTVITSGGENMQGELVSIDDSGVSLDRGNEVLSLAAEELSQLRFAPTVLPQLPMKVQLSGGSLLSITGVVWTDQTVTVTPARQSPIELPVEELRWVRFRTGNTSTDPTWLGWVEEARRADRLAVRRNEKSLDSIDGTVIGISRESVRFEMRGNEINAPVAKLEGVLLSTQNKKTPSTPIQVTDTSGSVWAAESIRFASGENNIEIQLPGSIRHDIPLNQVLMLQYAGGILSLSEAEIASASFGTQSSGSTQSALSSDMEQWFSPETEEGTIRVNAPGQITFRVPDGYQKLIIAARRGKEVNQFMAVRLEVLLDGSVQWTGVLQDRQSLGLELPLANARQLSLKATPLPKPDDPKSTTNTTSTNTSIGDISGTLGGTVEWFSGRLLK